MQKILFAAALGGLCATACAGAVADGLPSGHASAGTSVYVISPRDGETVSSPVTVRFGLKGMGIAPAGVARPDTGHLHSPA